MRAMRNMILIMSPTVSSYNAIRTMRLSLWRACHIQFASIRHLPVRTQRAHTMTTAQYLKALKKLGLTPMGQETEQTLGLEMTQLWRIAHGKCPVSPTLARLLACLASRRPRASRK